MKTPLKIVMATLLSISSLAVNPVRAQEADYRWDMGAKLGMAGYLGDYSGSTPFSSPGFKAALTAAYLRDVRWSFRGDLSMSTLSGKASSIGGAYPEWLPGSFSATVFELSVRAEFNFFPYGIGETYKGLKRWSPYLAAGLGVVGAKAKGESFSVAPEIPLAFGVRYKVKPRFNLLAEISITKTFTDAIDGVKDVYGIKSEWFKNTDWTASLTIGFTYEFSERCATCHYVD